MSIRDACSKNYFDNMFKNATDFNGVKLEKYYIC